MMDLLKPCLMDTRQNRGGKLLANSSLPISLAKIDVTPKGRGDTLSKTKN